MEASERVTWEDCPNCRRAAAVGWVNGRPVEFDCPRGCCLSAEQVQAFDARHGRRPVELPADRPRPAKIDYSGGSLSFQVDPETYQVTVDGEDVTCEPADVLPMAQRYFLF